MLMEVVDFYTKQFEVRVMSSIMAKVTMEQLRQIFATFGLPEILVSDNIPTLTVSTFQEFMEHNGIRLIQTAPIIPPLMG